MRIATSTLFDQQSTAIDNLVAQQAQFSNQLSTGKSVVQPSDDPTHIAQDLAVRNALVQDKAAQSNLQDVSAQLATTDGALSGLTNIVQEARQIAITGASDTVSPTQRQALAAKLENLIAESVGLANTSYAGQYIFGGSQPTATPPLAPTGAPVSTSGSPISAVSFTGNFQSKSQIFLNGSAVPVSTSLREAFNFAAADNSGSVFDVLIKLRDTLSKGQIEDTSAAQVNASGKVVNGATSLNANAGNFAVPVAADNGTPPSLAISIAGPSGTATLTFDPASATANSIASAITASNTGVTASFNAATQKMTLTASAPFTVTDVASSGATTAGNLTAVFGLSKQADITTNLSRQVGDVDHVLGVVLQARTVVGNRIQALSATTDRISQVSTDEAKVQSGLEDADIAKVVAQFSQSQTALQAAYSTTTRLEGKILFDYLR